MIHMYIGTVCKGNPGLGAWCVTLWEDDKQIAYVSGWEEDLSNNRTLLKATIDGLQMLEEPTEVTICCNALYLLRGIESQFGMYTGNRDLCVTLNTLLLPHAIATEVMLDVGGTRLRLAKNSARSYLKEQDL